MASSTDLFQDVLREVRAYLRSLPDKPEETAEGVVRALWFAAAGSPRSVEYASEGPLPPISEASVERLRTMVAQRKAGVPLAYLTGRQRFMGLELLVAPGGLIPRKETEILGRAALAALQECARCAGRVKAIDVCTGVGNIAVALASRIPNAWLYASDLSSDAVELAERNVREHGLEDRVEVRQGDLLAPFDDPEVLGTFDLVTCNPPYISSGKLKSMPDEIIVYEPRAAFDGGPFGVSILNRFIQEAPRYVRRGGRIAFEVGLGQGPAVIKRMDNRIYRDVQAVTDAEGNVRAVVATL